MNDKTVKLTGKATVVIDGAELKVTGNEGLVFATTGDESGAVVYMYHPLSGWYIERDMRDGENLDIACD
jgi:hypothetical protein